VARKVFAQFTVTTGLLFIAAVAGTASAQERAARSEPASYKSPYRVEFSVKRSELVADLEQSERGDPRIESEVPFSHWYSRQTLQRWHSWGPPARHYPPVPAIAEWPIEKQRERVVAVALRFIGYGYQHHHVPDWNPPADWPWKETCFGRNSRGVDCSNFTSFVYNLGFGVKLNSDVHKQSREREVELAGTRRMIPLRHIALPDSYDERVKKLKTGDLVFIRSNGGNISHVVLWVGAIGRAPDDVALIIDSHGENVRDSEGQHIPCGIQLRPFRENSWYNKSADHAIRIVDNGER
jgi:cell wall-associated NlpC family hydrolase